MPRWPKTLKPIQAMRNVASTVTTEELAKLEKVAAQLKQNKSTFIRELILRELEKWPD